VIYHLLVGEPGPGDYVGDTLATEGFIHCSTREQVAWVAKRWFKGKTGLVVLEIDETRLRSELRWVESEPGQSFPHVHGPIDRAAIVRVVPLDAFT
jgi:uncharacterized protein (DUF952 family)